MEKYRPIDWLTEWHKTHDLTEIGSDKNLLRGGRFRFYNGIKEDIMIEEVKMSLFVFNFFKTVKSVKLIMFIWKPTLAIFRVKKNYRVASR